MRYYKDKKNQVYAYDDDVSEEFLKEQIKELGLKSITEEEVKKLTSPRVNEKAAKLAELEEEIKETEEYINHAILIGNDAVLPELRSEYKELLAKRESLIKETSNGKE